MYTIAISAACGEGGGGEEVHLSRRSRAPPLICALRHWRFGFERWDLATVPGGRGGAIFGKGGVTTLSFQI